MVEESRSEYERLVILSSAKARMMKPALEKTGVVAGGATGAEFLKYSSHSTRVHSGDPTAHAEVLFPILTRRDNDARLECILVVIGVYRPMPPRFAAKSPRVTLSHSIVERLS
jgi:hypothetical protein